MGPLSVEFSWEVERMFFVGYVPWDDEEAKGDPCEEGVDREERAVVEPPWR